MTGTLPRRGYLDTRNWERSCDEATSSLQMAREASQKTNTTSNLMSCVKSPEYDRQFSPIHAAARYIIMAALAN